MVAIVMAISPAFAGNLNVANGQAAWQSTKCTEPVEPPALAALGPETRASSMNNVITQYNVYASAMQEYMNCVSNEAQTDANATADAITHSAQAIIDNAQKKVAALGLSPTKNKQ
jgi:hypothetical protein